MWALVDCDNFFCSCERAFRPDLARTPLVVLSNNDGCVVARSAETKAMGIKMGLPYYQLLEQYPGRGIMAFSSNYALYGDMSARIMAVLRSESPCVLQYSIDEAFIDLSGMTCDLKKWGEHLAAKVLRWTAMPVSIGIAPTKTLAKMASRYAKKYTGYNRCCCILDDSQRIKALSLFDVEDVWGIGRRIAARLKNDGITTALQFSQKPKEWVRSRFHITGERTWAELNGTPMIDIDTLDNVTKKSIMTSRSFPKMITNIADVNTHIANYAARCAAKLRRQHSVCSMMTVFVQSNFFRDDLPQYSNQASALFGTPTASTPELVQRASDLLKVVFRPGISYKRAGVMVADISSDAAIQPDLFDYDPALAARYRSISEAIDEINLRLGADTVILAAQQYPEKAADGKNLDFTHAIRRSLKSPNYSTRPDDFKIS